MKNEPQGDSGGNTFKSVKEVEGNAKTRMEKVLADLQQLQSTK